MATKFEANTIEELAALAVNHANYFKGDKFELREWSTTEWDDPEAGALYQAAEEAIREWYYNSGASYEEREKNYAEYRSRLDTLERPSTHNVTRYHLDKQGRYSHVSINLSEDLGKMIDEVWTKKPMYRGATYTKRVGGLSLAGMLKRLGQTSIGAQVKAAQEKADRERQERENRQWARARVKDLQTLQADYDQLAAKFADKDVPFIADLTVSMESIAMILERFAPGYSEE